MLMNAFKSMQRHSMAAQITTLNSYSLLSLGDISSSSLPRRNVLCVHLPKHRAIMKPMYFGNVHRKRDSHLKRSKFRYTSSDPLYFAHHLKSSNGGFGKWLEHIHDRQNFNMPLNRMCYVMYNMTKAEIYDPAIFAGFERNIATTKVSNLESRHCFGAVYAYYKSNQGT